MFHVVMRKAALIASLILSICLLYSAQAQNTTQNKIYLPLLLNGSPSATGNWTGYLLQPGKSFEFDLNLTQSGSVIQGTSTARDGDYFAVWNLSGTSNGNSIVLNEIDIIDDNTRPGWRWCIKEMVLSYSSAFGVPMLNGDWNDPGCNSGQLYLQPKSGPFLPINGTWTGTISQGATEYLLELSIQQNNSLLQGTANIRRNNDFGRLSLIGYVAGSNIRIEERAILETSGRIWCIKTMKITYKVINQVPTIEGSWTAPGCSPGNLTLTRR